MRTASRAAGRGECCFGFTLMKGERESLATPFDKEGVCLSVGDLSARRIISESSHLIAEGCRDTVEYITRCSIVEDAGVDVDKICGQVRH